MRKGKVRETSEGKGSVYIFFAADGVGLTAVCWMFGHPQIKEGANNQLENKNEDYPNLVAPKFADAVLLLSEAHTISDNQSR